MTTQRDPEETFLIPLTQGKFAIVEANDAHLLEWKWYAALEAKSNTFRAMRNQWMGDKCQQVKLHHAVIGQPCKKGIMVDHINGNTLDNRRSNLRIVTYHENNSNRRRRREGRTSSKFAGVRFHKARNKWHARITINGRENHLGYFVDEKDAATAYLNALSKIHSGAL